MVKGQGCTELVALLFAGSARHGWYFLPCLCALWGKGTEVQSTLIPDPCSFLLSWEWLGDAWDWGFSCWTSESCRLYLCLDLQRKAGNDVWASELSPSCGDWVPRPLPQLCPAQDSAEPWAGKDPGSHHPKGMAAKDSGAAASQQLWAQAMGQAEGVPIPTWPCGCTASLELLSLGVFKQRLAWHSVPWLSWWGGVRP